MVFSDTVNRQNGLIQRCEDICGLGAGGISGNTSLLSMFTGWLIQWNRTGASYAITNSNGADFDDRGYTTLPTGRLTGTTNRDYNLDESYKLLKFKTVAVSYDGVNINRAKPIDSADKLWLAKKDPNVDSRFSTSWPKFDERADGFELYPKFTAAQVALGAFIDIEWFRAPQDFAATGSDTLEPSLDLQFHHFPAVGASWEYCKINKPALATVLASDLYGYHGRYGATIPGLIVEIKGWYSSKQPSNTNLHVRRRVRR